jgi:hypothetical protein
MSNPKPSYKRGKGRPEPAIQPQPFNPGVPEYRKSSEDHDAHPKEDQDRKMSNRFVQALFGGGKAAMWTAVFTAALCLFSGLLYKVSKQATEASVASQRAFVSFVGLGGIDKINAPGGTSITSYGFHIPMVNSGSTATKLSTYEISVATLDSAPSATIDFESLPHSERSIYVFGPKQAFDGKPVLIQQNTLSEVEQGRKHLMIWGWNVYRDIFVGTPIHLSEFCMDVTELHWTKADHTDPSTEMKVAYEPCPTHNCYDEDCFDYSTRIGLSK